MMCCIKEMKKKIIEATKKQTEHLECADTEELGKAIDMIKDLCQAEYYHAIVKAMEEDEEMTYYPEEMMYHKYRYEDRKDQPMKDPRWAQMDHHKDEKEGKSHMQRKCYMECKEHHHEKKVLMDELEKYTRDLTNDIVEMMVDASPEEIALLRQKMVALLEKVK